MTRRAGEVDLVVGNSLEQCAERHTPLHAGHVGAQALMCTGAEAQDAFGPPADVEAIGRVELARVAVRRGEEEEDRLAGAELAPVEREVLAQGAAELFAYGTAVRVE